MEAIGILAIFGLIFTLATLARRALGDERQDSPGIDEAEVRQLVNALVRESALTTLAIGRDEYSGWTTGAVWTERELIACRVLQDFAGQLDREPDPEAPTERLIAAVRAGYFRGLQEGQRYELLRPEVV